MNTLRLYRQFQPKHYDVRLVIQRIQRQFSGTVTINGNLQAAGEQLILHAHKLDVLAANIDGQPAVFEASGDELRLKQANLAAGEHTVDIEFSGKITKPMHGLYPCFFTLDGKDEELLATQFESHHAREVFPCIDEPEAKATFDLTLTTETGVTVIANTPVKDQHEAEGQLVTAFQTSPVMSTYLLAWVVGKLDFEETTTKDGVLIRAYATPDKKDQVGFALQTARKTIEFYNDYFAIAYPLPKCDMVALPDFSSGAMENWGLITYRETALLVDEANTSAGMKQYVAMVVGHELAHQWFGNLVTPRWWNDLWLNESFASWVEYLACNQLFPEWDMWTQFYDRETTYAMQRDGLASVQKIHQEVNDPEEIRTLFDPAIVYAKGASLLHMLQGFLGPEAVRDGLRLYLRRHQYSNTQASDLWKALGEVSRQDVEAFMEPWIDQAGLPVVTVGTSQQTATLHQRRFYNNPKEAVDHNPTTWPIPLLAGGQLSTELFTEPTVTLQVHNTQQPLLLNQGRGGYYLSLYDSAHMQRLAQAVLANKLPVIDRLGLLSDSLRLAKAGLQTEAASLTLLEAYKDEQSQPVWGAITDHLAALKMFVEDDEALRAQLRDFIKNLARKQFERLGWQRIPGEPYFDELLRPTIIGHMAYSEDPEVIQHLQTVFAQAAKPSDIFSDIRATVFATAAKFGSQKDFERLLAWYGATTSAEERINLTAGIASTRDPVLIERALAMLTTDAVKLQDLFYWFIYFIRSRYSREQTWQWLQQHWQWITDNYGNDMHYTEFPKYSASAFSTRQQFDSYKQFFGPKQEITALTRIITQGLEDIESRVLWRERDSDSVAAYLRQFTTNHPPSS